MHHFLYGYPAEETCEEIIALIVAVKVKVHILMQSRNLVGDRFV
jgi:hypothetical protein